MITFVKGSAVLMKSYNERLKELRIDQDLRQRDVAEILHITREQYILYETGKRQMKLDQLTALCRYYQVSADSVLGLPRDLSWPR